MKGLQLRAINRALRQIQNKKASEQNKRNEIIGIVVSSGQDVPLG
jgi:hypothetical protein